MADNKVNSGLLEFSEDQKVFVALDAETSEVEKAVVIDADGVETDIQGVQPSGKKEITSTAEVNVAKYATAQVVDEDLVAGNIKKDVDILGVVGSYEPEAPASDFSTAEVSVIVNGQDNYFEAFGSFYDNITKKTFSSFSVNSELHTSTTNIILAENGAHVLYDLNGHLSYSGDITDNPQTHTFEITGNCTITVGSAT